MKIKVHTIINVFCPDDGATEMQVLGSFINEEEARACFQKQKQIEIDLTQEHDWIVYCDEDTYYEAGEDGNYNNNFGALLWYSQEFEI